MSRVKKFDPIKNASLRRQEYGVFLGYLNEMSAKGLHITTLGNLVNTFEKDKSKRYIYSVCGEDREYFLNSDVWELAAEKGKAFFYRKKIPTDAVSIKAEFIDAFEENEWLEDHFERGYLLFGTSCGEYFFVESDKLAFGEYVLERIGHRADIGSFLKKICTNGRKFICCRPDGGYYFFIPDVNRASRKKHLRKSIKKASAASILSAIFMAVSVIFGGILVAFGLVSESMTPVILGVCSGIIVLGGLFIAVMRLRSKVFAEKYRRLVEAEQNGAFSADIDTAQGGNAFSGESELTDVPKQGEMNFECDEEMAKEPDTNLKAEDQKREPMIKKMPLLKKLGMGSWITVFVLASIYCILWFNRLLPGIFASAPVGLVGFIAAIVLIVVFPFKFYSILGK